MRNTPALSILAALGALAMPSLDRFQESRTPPSMIVRRRRSNPVRKHAQTREKARRLRQMARGQLRFHDTEPT